MKRILPIALLVPLFAAGLASPASASVARSGPTAPDVSRCVASDPADVDVDSEINSVVIRFDEATAGNNFGCYTNRLTVAAGDTITFNHTSTVCGGGVPRLFFRFNGNRSGNTHDGNLENCTVASSATPVAGTPFVPGTVTYTFTESGQIKSFAFINDSGAVPRIRYSNLVIAGNVIDF